MSQRASHRSSALAFAAAQARDLTRIDRPLLVWFCATSLGRAFTTVAVIFLIRDFLAGVLGQPIGAAGWLSTRLGPETVLWALAAVLVAVFVIGACCLYASTVAMQRLIRRLELDLMERLMTRLVQLPVSFFDRRHRGDVVQTIREDVSKTRAAAAAFVEMGLHGAQALAYTGAAAVISPRLVLVCLPVLVFAAVPARALAHQVRGRSSRVRGHAYRLTDLLLELLHGIRVVKVYAGESAAVRGNVAAARQYFDEVVGVARVRALAEVLLDAAGGLGVVVIVVAGGFEVLQARLTVPSLVALLVAVRAATGPLNTCFARLMDIQRNWASSDNVRALLALQPEIRDRPDAAALAEPIQSIRFERVSFRYDGQAAVLADVSFAIEAGQQVGIVGPSGAGKTTLLSLLARFYEPSSGRILINGRDLRDYRRSDVYAQMSLVTQDAVVFSTSVRDNIRYGRPAATDADVERAAADAEIHDDIAALPDGYDTVLGPGGRLLSAGQVQRINIARAVVKDARVVLLDEATSNLDTISERRIQTAMERLTHGRTTITVAHRLTTLRSADLILVLDGGRLVASGTHDVLLASCELYGALWRAQEAGA